MNSGQPPVFIRPMMEPFMKLVKTERGEIDLWNGIRMSISVNWSAPELIIHYFYSRPEAGPGDFLGKGSIKPDSGERAKLGKLLSSSSDDQWILGSQPGVGGHKDVTEAFREVKRIAYRWAEAEMGEKDKQGNMF